MLDVECERTRGRDWLLEQLNDGVAVNGSGKDDKKSRCGDGKGKAQSCVLNMSLLGHL